MSYIDVKGRLRMSMFEAQSVLMLASVDIGCVVVEGLPKGAEVHTLAGLDARLEAAHRALLELRSQLAAAQVYAERQAT